MRFRDLAIFNDYLLSKQAWWVLHDTKTLFIVSSRHTSFPIVLLLRQRSWPRGHMLGRAHYTVGMLSKEALVGGWDMGDQSKSSSIIGCQ